MHTKQSLMNDLYHAGIAGTDTVLIHSSMKSIGNVQGGADTVLDAWIEYMAEGLLVLPAHTWNYIHSDNPVFDVRESKSCVGILTELFRNRQGVIRSLHPTHSLCARGETAEAFLKGQERFDTPCAPESCYGKLLYSHAKVLLVGVNFSKNTLVHGIEEIANISGRLTDTFQRLIVKDYEGNRIQVPSRRHDNAKSRRYVKLEPVMFQRGVLKKVKFGDADCLIMNTKDLLDVTLELLEKNSRLFDDSEPIIL